MPNIHCIGGPSAGDRTIITMRAAVTIRGARYYRTMVFSQAGLRIYQHTDLYADEILEVRGLDA